MKSLKKGAFWAGWAVVLLTHVYMLAFGLPEGQMVAHAVLNLVAAALLVYALLS